MIAPFGYCPPELLEADEADRTRIVRTGIEVAQSCITLAQSTLGEVQEIDQRLRALHLQWLHYLCDLAGFPRGTLTSRR